MSKNAIFSPNWVFGPFLPLWPSDIFLTWSENKKWFFSQNNHFLFTKQSILMAGKLAAVITQIYFGKFCYCVPGWKISKHGFFEHLGGPLWPCDSLLLWTRLFIQIHSEILCWSRGWFLIHTSKVYRVANFKVKRKDHKIDLFI